MKFWWNDLTGEDIQWLKDNRIACNMLTVDELELISLIPWDDREVKIWGPDGWKQDRVRDNLDLGGRTCVYRLRPNWTRDKATNKVGCWIYYDVYLKKEHEHAVGLWCFNSKSHDGIVYSLGEVLAMQGFGGVEFKEKPGMWSFNIAQCVVTGGGLGAWVYNQINDNTDGIPATPNRVRFWVEDK